MRTRVLIIAAVLALTGCSDEGSTDSPGVDATDTSTAPATEERLAIGKDDLELDAVDYLSPEGFEPELEIALGKHALTGWSSVHRSADAFDLGQPNPEVDAPLVAVAFLVPAEDDAEDALETARLNAVDAGAQVSDPGPLAELATEGIEVTDGEGQVVASRDGGIALDAQPGARLQIWAADYAGHPMLIVVFTPDAALSAEADALVEQLARSVTFS